MTDSETNDLGGPNSLCDNLIPIDEPDVGEDSVLDYGSVAEFVSQTESQIPGYMDQGLGEKPKRTWKWKVYPVSAVRRSARFKIVKKDYDER